MASRTWKTVALSLLAVGLAFVTSATDYYVDAVNGNDDWDGSSSNYVSGVTGPKRTLEGMASVVPANQGHTIWALPGWYDSKTNAAYAARVNLPAKTRLISTGGRDVTFIVGSCTNGAPESCLKGPDVTRCVSMFDNCVLQGFTLVGGRALTYTGNENTAENHNGGVRFNISNTGAGATPTFVVDCVITNCAAMRGGASYGQDKSRCFFVNCRITGCEGKNPMSVIAKASLWNCVIDGSETPGTAHNTIANCNLWNCTMANPAAYNSMASCEAWNCLFPAMTDKGDNAFHYCLTSLAKNDTTTWDKTTQVAESKLRLNANYRPDSLENAGLNAGDDASYEASFTKFDESVAFVSDVTPLLQKDWLGGPRIACGAIDIGAGEFSIADVKGLTMTVTDLGDGTSRLSVSQDPAGERYVSTFSFDGETVSLDANAPGWTWTKVISGGLGDYALLPVYADVNCYYVDNLNGDDGDTGVGRFHAVKTIQTAMNKVAKDGTVRVMPGTYSHVESKTVDSNGKSNVVVFKQQNVTLESVQGPRWTIIEGNPVQGEEGVRCVHANQSGAVVRGFTLRNGGTPKIDGAGNGAGVYYGTAVDCVITGCKAGGRGGAAYGSTLVRCYMEDCTMGPGTGSAMENGKMYGCVVKGLTYYGSGCVAVNCTFIDGHPSYGALRGNGSSLVEAYNVLLIGGNNQASAGGCKFHNSIITGGIAGTDKTDDDCKVGVGTADYPYDPVTFRPLAGAGQVNVGSNSYYEAKYPAAYKDEYLDFAGGARIVDEVIDIGAGEYSAESARLLACSQALATDGRVTVTAADAGVAAAGAGTVAIPADASLTLDWDIPYGGTGAAAYRYRVELAPGATLKVYECGELVEEIATSGDHQFRSAVNHHFTFVAAGGTAVLSSFSNMGYLTVVDAKGRMVVTGASLGTTEVFPGESVTATFARDGYVKPLLEGIRVNGEFRSFSGAEADVVRTVEVTDASGLVTVEAVYAVTNNWYVDADKGIDTNDGFTPYRARKTLVEAMKLATTAGDVVHAAPGVYAEGGVATLTTTTNRVEVAANCGLVADQGPAVTVIEGRWSTDESAKKGCGPDAIRCAALGSGAWIRGFTLRYGATVSLTQYAENGGGVYGAHSNCSAIDCIIENCRAQRGGACSNGTYVRCLTRGNDSVDECGATLGGLSGYDAAGYYGCVFTDGLVYGNIGKVVNCSFIGTALKGNTTWPHVYNSYVYLDDSKCKYHNCVYGSRTIFSGDAVQYNSELDDDCVQASGDAVAVDANHRPLATATALLDKGRSDYYDDNWTAKWPGATDVADGQRVYNAAIDIGAGEYDWRPVYASRLVGRRGEVVAASAGATEGETGVVLAGGESLTVDWTAKRTGTQTFSATVTGEGTLTVLADGAPLAPADGVYSFEAEAGSVTRLEISFAGTGSAEVLKFCGPPVGMLLLVR